MASRNLPVGRHLSVELYVHGGLHKVLRKKYLRFSPRNRLMDLYLQFGYGMMEHCRSLVADWGGGTVILSPRDLKSDQLTRLAREITGLTRGAVLLDPQFYLPHADHERLRSHDYWPQNYATGSFWQGADLASLLEKIRRLNEALNCSTVILPGLLATRVDADWLTVQDQIVDEARANLSRNEVMATVALSGDALRNDEQVSVLIERARNWDVGAFYVVAEHPAGKYLVDDPSWLANLLDLVGSMRMQGARVILGYCNQQMLIAGCAKASAIASGTWMNVRSFPPDKFRATYEEEVKQRATWYYCPQGLSEYKIPFLDVAHRMGVLLQMTAPRAMNSGYADDLFLGPQPSSVPFTEQLAFRHFLQCLHSQTNEAVAATFEETVLRHTQTLDAAEALLTTLAASGVRGQLRDFRDTIDVNRAALAVFKNTRGLMLARKWGSIPT
jgi:hypothetical protein